MVTCEHLVRWFRENRLAGIGICGTVASQHVLSFIFPVLVCAAVEKVFSSSEPTLYRLKLNLLHN